MQAHHHVVRPAASEVDEIKKLIEGSRLILQRQIPLLTSFVTSCHSSNRRILATA